MRKEFEVRDGSFGLHSRTKINKDKQFLKKSEKGRQGLNCAGLYSWKAQVMSSKL